ncbi:MAG: nucleotide exchange factor GrpE [Pseudomonadota bacterium]
MIDENTNNPQYQKTSAENQSKSADEGYQDDAQSNGSSETMKQYTTDEENTWDYTQEPEDHFEQDIQKIMEDHAVLKERNLRLMAEMENLRRRTQREIADKQKYAVSTFARDVVAVADNLQRAMQSIPQETMEQDSGLKPLFEGIAMTERELLNVLEKHGISRIEPRGQIFDPNIHQAMFEVENVSLPAGTVVEVVQAGFVIGERVLRPALVGIAKGGPKFVPGGPKVQQSNQDPNMAQAQESGPPPNHHTQHDPSARQAQNRQGAPKEPRSQFHDEQQRTSHDEPSQAQAKGHGGHGGHVDRSA